jgi:hypothetical protein
LEGKGPVIFDYRNTKMYCSISQRASREVLDDLIAEWNKISLRPYRAVAFESFDKDGNIIYHTDCMMTLLHDHAVLCVEAIEDEKEKERVISELTDENLNNHAYKLIEISRKEVKGMCANMFNLVNQDGENVVVMSGRAYRTYSEDNIQEIEANYKVAVANIDMIEHIGGGSTRCMLAEKF